MMSDVMLAKISKSRAVMCTQAVATRLSDNKGWIYDAMTSKSSSLQATRVVSDVGDTWLRLEQIQDSDVARRC